MLKKLISAFLIATMAFSMTACSADPVVSTDTTPEPSEASEEESSEESEEETTPADTENQIIVASTTDINGDMMSGWSNNASNAQIKVLIHGGAATVSYTREGRYEPNQQVLDGDIATTENADGTKTYTVKIKDTLKYNDGTPIMAVDYIFGIMLGSSPEFGSLDADNFSGDQVVGFEAFNEGTTKQFTGLRLLGDYEFSITILAEEFPYYYEETFAAASPTPMHVIAPEVTITDDGTGAVISDNFTSELLQETINNSETGYRYAPMVTTGPYQFVSFDLANQEAILEINPNYEGTYDGVQPSIEKLIFKTVTTATQFDELEAGSVDILYGISGGDSIERGLSMSDEGLVDYATYPRNGFGMIRFANNHGPTQYQEVRQAIAYCIDREEFAREYTGGYGSVVHGNYGLAQWEYQENKDELDEVLIKYTLDLDKAEQLLIDNGWTLNATGGEYVKGTDDVRYKDIDGTLTGLTIEWANTQPNPVTDQIARVLPDAMAEIGMKLNGTTLDLNVMFDNMYQMGGLQNYHMFNMGTGFATTSAHWYYFDPELGGAYNTTFTDDEELYNIALDMKATESGDTEAWSEKWVDLQIRWNELMPEIPLYSDEYHDFYDPKLQNYNPTAVFDFEYDVVYANVG